MMLALHYKLISSNMYAGNWPTIATSISIEMISPKQLIGECLDLAAVMLRELIEVYCNNNKIELPFTHQVPLQLFRRMTFQPAWATSSKDRGSIK